MKPNYVTVIGQGYVGLPLSIRIAEKGNICFGLDSSQELITDLKKRNLINYDSNTAKKLTRLIHNRSYLPTTDYKVILDSQVILICLPTPLTLVGKPDLKILNKSLKEIKKVAKPQTLIILESTVNPGLTRSLEKLFPK